MFLEPICASFSKELVVKVANVEVGEFDVVKPDRTAFMGED